MTDNVRGLDAARVNHGFIAAIVVVATIGGFMFGYDSGVINGTQKGLEAAFDLGRLGVGVNVGAIWSARRSVRSAPAGWPMRSAAAT